MIQAPNLVNPYRLQPMYACATTPAPTYNAVKIDVHNPSMSAPGVGQVAMNMPQTQPEYAQPTMPYYTYPQAQLYDYPQATAQVPYYIPQQPVVCPPCPACQPAGQQVATDVVKPQIATVPTTPVAPQAVETVVAPQVVQPIIQQQNINAPAPMVTQDTNKVEIEAPQKMTPQVDLNSFIAKLTNPDFEIQANAMEEIANMVKEDPQKATELLDEKIINTLNTIMNADSSKLAGPTQEQLTARIKLNKGEQISDAEKQLATTITPMEQAERNKSYAMFTTAILQKLYGEEVTKLTGSTVPLTELPGAVTVVEQLKNNDNPMVRTSAIEALSYIQQPAYKQDLNTLFTIAQKDNDKNVQEAATAALAKLAQI